MIVNRHLVAALRSALSLPHQSNTTPLLEKPMPIDQAAIRPVAFDTVEQQQGTFPLPRKLAFVTSPVSCTVCDSFGYSQPVV